MKYLEPKKIRVNSMMAVSHQTNEDQEEILERRVFLGFFEEEISSLDIEKALSENDLWLHVVTSEAFYEGSFRAVSAVPRLITEGIVFENTDEFVQYLKAGLGYNDILEGYAMAKMTGDKGVQVQ